MSGRNNRIVRNRDRSSSNFDFSSHKVKIVIGIIVVILIGIAIFAVHSMKNSSSGNHFVVCTSEPKYEYFLLSSNDNLGVIDKSGNIIIEPKYTQIYIPNPEKDVFVCYRNENEYEILNKEASRMFADFENVAVIKSSNENQEVEKYVLKYRKNDLYGLVGFDGTIKTDAIYDEISSLADKPGALLVKKDDKYGILNADGNTIIDIKYDNILSDGYCSEDEMYAKTGYIVSEKTKDGVNFGYIDARGNSLLDAKYESLERVLEYDDDDIYLIAMQKGKKGVFKNKKEMIDLNFQDITYSDLSNIFIVNKNGKYGFFKLDGKTILKPEYSKYSIAGNYISVEKDNEKKLFDVNGNLVGTNSYTKMIETENPAYFIAEDEEGFFSIISKDVNIDEKYVQVQYAFDNYFIFTDESGKTGVVNAVTKEVEINPQYDFILLIEGTKTLQAVDGMENLIDIYGKDLTKTITMEDGIVETLENGYSICYSETDMKYFNADGEIVENTEVYPDEKLYATQNNEKWGFADKTGKTVVECQYDIVTEFNEYGFAGIKKDGKWGVVNQNGEIIAEPTYELDTYYFPQFIGKYLLLQSEITYCEEIQ